MKKRCLCVCVCVGGGGGGGGGWLDSFRFEDGDEYKYET